MISNVNPAPAQSEVDFLLQKGELPIIEDGAYINFIEQTNGSALGVIHSGIIETIWN